MRLSHVTNHEVCRVTANGPGNPSTIASSAISFAPVRKAFEIIVQAYQYRKSIRQLRQLDSRMLADIPMQSQATSGRMELLTANLPSSCFRSDLQVHDLASRGTTA